MPKLKLFVFLDILHPGDAHLLISFPPLVEVRVEVVCVGGRDLQGGRPVQG